MTFDLNEVPTVVLANVLRHRGYLVVKDKIDSTVRLNDELIRLKGDRSYTQLVLENHKAVRATTNAWDAQVYAAKTGGKTVKLALTSEATVILRRMRDAWEMDTDAEAMRAFMYALLDIESRSPVDDGPPAEDEYNQRSRGEFVKD